MKVRCTFEEMARGHQAMMAHAKGNNLEIVRVSEGVVTIDHAAATMRADWDCGRTETWSPCKRGYSRDVAFKTFRDCIKRWSE